MIEINNLIFRYPSADFSLNISHLNIQKKEKIAVIGASGCVDTPRPKGTGILGSSIRLAIKVPNQGIIQIDSVNIEKLNDRDRRQFRIKNIGFIFST